MEERQEYEERQAELHQAALGRKVALLLGRPYDLELISFAEEVKVAFWMKRDQKMRANRRVEKIDVLWQEMECALVRVHFVKWKPDHDYDTSGWRYELLTPMKESEVVFVTGASLRKFLARENKSA